jgi:spore germination cell wall hydrolase CwlJ-like protein
MNTSERLGIASVGAKALIIALMMCFPLIQTSHASQIPSEVYCIIGEAEGEGYEGMLAVSEAIRNRGSLKGVYGCQASRVKNRLYSQAVLQTANLAWQNSLHTNTVRGATHWEGTAFKTPYWAKDMIVTATIRNQRFYKERGTK